MGSIVDKMNYLLETKKGIREAISAKGVSISDDDTFRSYADKIASIETGGDSPTPDMPVIGDGKTYLYIKITGKGRMTVPLYFSQTVAYGVTIDWGDGSATQTLNYTGDVNTSHTYADVGEYTISLKPSSNCTLGLGRSGGNCVMGGTTYSADAYYNMLQAVEIGKNVKSIGNYAFRYCYSLASIVIPDGVTSIGNYAFQKCYSLRSIVIPKGVTSIGKFAFEQSPALASITIPDSVTSIAENAFYGCKSLRSIVIPKGVTSIGSSAFHSSSLASIVIPDSVTSISSYLFSYCTTLASVTIPDSVTSIESRAFQNCTSLVSIVIPKGVRSIGDYAFSYMNGMACYDFTQCTSVPTLGGTSVFTSIASDCKIVVPDGLYDTWISATNWSAHASKIVKASEFNG